MNRKLLDALYAHLYYFENEFNQLKETREFPDDGYSFEVHKSRTESSHKMTVIFNSLIDIYVGE